MSAIPLIAPPLIELKDASLTLGNPPNRIQILQQLSLEVYAGETVAVVGPSGSGKTSLLMLIAGLEPATSGRVRVGESEHSQGSEAALARFRNYQLGIVFQSFHLIPTMTALENVQVPLELRGQAEVKEPATEALQRVGLGDRLNHLPSQLSGGEQQRVAIARAMVGKPPLLLADEPTGNLDQETGAHVLDVLFNLHRDLGTTLLIVTHDMGLAQRCQRQIRLVQGHIESV